MTVSCVEWLRSLGLYSTALLLAERHGVPLDDVLSDEACIGRSRKACRGELIVYLRCLQITEKEICQRLGCTDPNYWTAGREKKLSTAEAKRRAAGKSTRRRFVQLPLPESK